MEEKTAVSLFSGLGGIDIGLHRAGIKTKVCIDKDPAAAKTLRINSAEHEYNPYRDTPLEVQERYPWKVIEKDIRDVTVEEVLEEGNLEKDDIDLVVGGSPCQPFSKSNTGSRKGAEEGRGKLYEEYVRLLEELEPTVFMFENVRGLKSTNDGKDFHEIKTAFEDAGYKINDKLVNTANFGVPQRRKRLVIIGHRNRKPDFPEPTHMKNPSEQDRDVEKWISVGEALSDLDIDEKVEEQGGYVNAIQGKHGHLLKDIPPGANYQHFTERKFDPEEKEYVERDSDELEDKVFGWRTRHYNYLLKLDPERPSWTIQARPGSYTGPFHWRARRLSQIERKRLMDIPINYHVEGDKHSEIQWQIGNAVPPALAESIVDNLFENK